MERKAAHIKGGGYARGPTPANNEKRFARGKGDRGFRMVCESVYGGGTTGI